MTFKVDPCWFGERKVVYVQVEEPHHKGSGRQKHFVVYGHTLDKVATEVFRGLAKVFGWHGGGHQRKGRPLKKRRTSKR